ncbi:hypothetical protein DPMN_009434 [Dreissena polymorpha]|uniref:Uncharacterized protein n=1 Tax=Dreissena polymorpha TaxID=45954 RepID=A0A9D4MY22_DREPO|nr:hypothetical protein DPMN_009434 [Dreissena polymorpha]
MLRPRIMKLHRYIDHDWQMTPIDFQVTRSKFKVTLKENKKIQLKKMVLEEKIPQIKLVAKLSEDQMKFWDRPHDRQTDRQTDRPKK